MTSGGKADPKLKLTSRRMLLTAATTSLGALMLAACGGANQAETAEAASDGTKTALARKPGMEKPPAPGPAPAPVGMTTVTWSSPALSTDGSALTDLVGYRIYYGTTSSNLTKTVNVSGATVTSQVVNGLASGTYYFAVAAIDSADVANNLTNLVSVTIP